MKAVQHLRRENKGATSVLIMIMMIILMVFGLAALTTSAASKKLAEKNAQWISEFYLLQGKAETLYAKLSDRLLLPETAEVDKIEENLNSFLLENTSAGFQKTGDAEKPFLIQLNVEEEGKETPKLIKVEIEIRKNGNFYELHPIKWQQTQQDIFSDEEEFEFSDIKVEL